jgi:hypothetical protein
MEDNYSAEDIRILEGMEPPRHPSKYPPLHFDLRPKKLHGITQEESDRRRASVERSIRLIQSADLQPTSRLLSKAAQYISGEISWEQYQEI